MEAYRGVSLTPIRKDSRGNSRVAVPYTAVPFRERGRLESVTAYNEAHYRHAEVQLKGKRYYSKDANLQGMIALLARTVYYRIDHALDWSTITC